MESLLYLSNTTRREISYVLGIISRYLEKPGKSDWNSVLHELRFLSGIVNHRIPYCSNFPTSMSNLVGNSAADFSGDRDERKYTTGWLFLLTERAARWCRKKQSLTSHSTVEAEFIALSFSMREDIFLRILALETGLMGHGLACYMRLDNQGFIDIARTVSLY